MSELINRLVLREETKSDYASIGAIHIDNFNHTLEADLICNLRKLPNYIPALSEVLVLDNEVVGHIMITPVKIANCKNEISAVVVGPVSIKKQYQGKGFGTKMVSDALNVIKKLGYDIVLVYGGDYYKRFGFESAPYIFRPNPMPGHGILVKYLKKQPEEPVAGVIHYPHPFDPLINEWSKN